MAKLFDWECSTCQAIFEQWDNNPVCVHCGSKKIHKVYITPPGKMSGGTKFMDSAISGLTAAHGMTDYQNDPSRVHDKPNQMTIAALDPKKDIGEQAAARVANMRGPISHQQIASMPHNRGKPITNIPLLDPASGNELRRITEFNRKENYRQRQTEVIARVDRNGRVT